MPWATIPATARAPASWKCVVSGLASVPEGAPPGFADVLYARVSEEDLACYGPAALAGLAALVSRNRVKSPAVIVIGEVTALDEQEVGALALEALQ